MNWKILIIDDEKTIRQGLRHFTEEILGPTVTLFTAKNSEEALRLVEKEAPQVVFADINLPDMNGLDLVEIIKHRLPDVTIIMISGYEDFPYTKKAIQLKVEDYLLKPVPKTDLKKVLLKLQKKFSPDTKENTPQTFQENYNLEEIETYIQNNYQDKNLNLKQVATRFFVTGNYLSKQMKTNLGASFVEYVMQLRIQKAQELLKQEKNYYTIQEIANKVGYEDPHYFSRVFKKITGKSPLQYQKEES